jgi:thiamine-monophosphate kinase
MNFMEDQNQEKRTEISSLGEFGTIQHLTKDFDLTNQSSIKGVGDDAALIYRTENDYTVVSTDFLIEGVHFNLMYMPFKHLGYKSVAVNVSDICAMNAVAEQITVSIAVSNRFPLEALEEFYHGVKAACDHFKVDLVGGDTTASRGGMIISVTAIGKVQKNKVSYRSGANANDILIVTGDLGGAYMGLQVLERERNVFESNPNIQPDLDGKDYIIQRQLKAEARTDVIDLLAKLDVVPSSMIDVSDGLASEVLHLCEASNKGVRLYNNRIPIDSLTSTTAIDFNLDPATCALNGGEDYELLFTINQADFDKVKGNPHFTMIGFITEANEGKYLVDANDSMVELKAQGWNHF